VALIIDKANMVCLEVFADLHALTELEEDSKPSPTQTGKDLLRLTSLGSFTSAVHGMMTKVFG
jgi:hypothetical protein